MTRAIHGASAAEQVEGRNDPDFDMCHNAYYSRP